MTHKNVDPDIRKPARLPTHPIFLASEKPRRDISSYLDNIETKLACDIAGLGATTRNILIVLIARIRLGVQKGEDTTEFVKHLKLLAKHGVGTDPLIKEIYQDLGRKWDSEMGR